MRRAGCGHKKPGEYHLGPVPDFRRFLERTFKPGHQKNRVPILLPNADVKPRTTLKVLCYQ